MLSYLAPILVFGLVIFVHELGHFLAAKAMGVYAPRFSIGFGPALLKFRRGETEYILAALPLGGYVRMASRLDEETAFLEGGSEEKAAAETKEWEDPDAMIPFGPKPVPPDRWFESKSLPARLFIMIAGVAMNVLLAFVVYTGLILHGGTSILPTTVLGAVPSIAEAPELERLRPGDTVRAVNGRSVSTWNELLQSLAQTGRTLTVVTQRDSVAVPIGDMRTLEQLFTGLDYYVPAVIDSVIRGQPAASAGFLAGDSVVAIGGEPVAAWSDLIRLVGASAGRPVTFDIVRDGSPRSLTVTPQAVPVPNQITGAIDTLGRIGAARRSMVVREEVNFAEGVRAGARETISKGTTVITVVRGLFGGSVSVKNLGGPIAITRLSVDAARGGVETLFSLIAFLSINIAVLNLLPIPILDGGQILMNIIESAKGSPFSLRTREYILRFGLVAIGLLFAVVMFNDTRGGIERLINWLAGRFSSG